MATGKDVVASGQTWVAEKVPYLWGGVTKVGADCSGFVQSVLGGLGVPVGRTTYDQVKQGAAVQLSGAGGLQNAQPGDILFFGDSAGAPTHEGIYVGNGQMIDEPHSGAVARQENVWGNLVAVRRFTSNGPNISGAAYNTVDATGDSATQSNDINLLSLGSYKVNVGKSGVIRAGVILAGIVFVLVALHALTSNAATPVGVVGDGSVNAASNVIRVVRNKSKSGSSSRTVKSVSGKKPSTPSDEKVSESSDGSDNSGEGENPE